MEIFNFFHYLDQKIDCGNGPDIPSWSSWIFWVTAFVFPIVLMIIFGLIAMISGKKKYQKEQQVNEPKIYNKEFYDKVKEKLEGCCFFGHRNFFFLFVEIHRGEKFHCTFILIFVFFWLGPIPHLITRSLPTNELYFLVLVYPIAIGITVCLIIGEIIKNKELTALTLEKEMGVVNVEERCSEAAKTKNGYTHEPRNVYCDFSTTKTHVMLIFCLQVFLAGLYIWGIFDQGRPCLNQNGTIILLYFSAFLKTIYYVLDLMHTMKDRFIQWNIWGTTVPTTAEFQVQVCDSQNTETILKTLKPGERNFRLCLSLFTNYFMDILLSVFIVINGANGGLLDFVLNFVAARFIIELDDYGTWNGMGYAREYIIKTGDVDSDHGRASSAAETLLKAAEDRMKNQLMEELDRLRTQLAQQQTPVPQAKDTSTSRSEVGSAGNTLEESSDNKREERKIK